MARLFPDGVRFCPSDEELIVSYLQRRAQGLSIFPGLVIDYDVYTCEPWKLPSLYFIYGNEGEMYFFTPRHSMSIGHHKKTSRFHVRRAAGEGSWESNGSTKAIFNSETVIGSRTALVFKRKHKVTGAVTKTDWIMQEYLLVSPANQELALCKIYYNGKKDRNNWEGMANTKKRKLTNEPPSTCAATFSACSDVASPTISTVFSPPEISNCMTQYEASDDQFLIPEAINGNICPTIGEIEMGITLVQSASSYTNQLFLPNATVGIVAIMSSEMEIMPVEQTVQCEASDDQFLIPEAINGNICPTIGEIEMRITLGQSASSYTNQLFLPNATVGIEAIKSREMKMIPVEQTVQLVTKEEEVKEQNAAATVTDQELSAELASPSYQCTVNLPIEEEEIITPVGFHLEYFSLDKTYCTSEISPLNEDNCFEGLDDILNLQDYDLWGSSYWH